MYAVRSKTRRKEKKEETASGPRVYAKTKASHGRRSSKSNLETWLAAIANDSHIFIVTLYRVTVAETRTDETGTSLTRFTSA